MIAFDLDPGSGADVLTRAEVAFLLKDLLDRLKLKSFVKMSGSKGLQLYVPLNTPVTYTETQPFARTNRSLPTSVIPVTFMLCGFVARTLSDQIVQCRDD